jgi:hypothetical protein
MSARVRAADGSTFEVRQKTSVLITVFAGFAWLGVIVAFLVALAGLVYGLSVSSLLLLALAAYSAINARILSFLRTKGDISTDRATVSTTSGASVTLRRDGSFWISLEMALTVIAFFFALGVAFFGASANIPGLGSLTAVAGGIVAVILLAYVLVLNFLRKKLVLEGPDASIPDLNERVIRLTKHTSIWVTLGMVVSLLFSLYLLLFTFGPLVTLVNDLSSFASGSNSIFGQGLFASDVIQALAPLIAFVFSLVSVAVLNFLRTKVNVEVTGIRASGQGPSGPTVGQPD